MNNSIAEQFREALNFLLHQEGRGAQVRLSVAQDIDRGYLNAVIKGRKPGAEETRLKIADHFGITYEAMLTLGRAIQNGTVIQGQGVSQLGSLIDKQQGLERDVRVPDKLKSETLHQALEVLTSGTQYSAILTEMIDALHKAVKENRGNGEMGMRMKVLEERLSKLERVAGGK